MRVFLEASYRELKEETGIDADNIDLISHATYTDVIPSALKTSVGFVFQARLKKPIQYEGYEMQGNEIAYVKPFTRPDLVRLLENPEQIYRPDFNVGAINFWLNYMKSPFDVW